MNQATAITERAERAIEKEDFLKIVNAFKSKANAKSITAEDVIFYNAARGLDLRRGFTPITNKRKLENGQLPNSGFDNAAAALKRISDSKYHILENQFGAPASFQSVLSKALREP